MSIFGQVWLWSLLAFAIGTLLTWLVLVRPAQKRIRLLEGRLAIIHAEYPGAAVAPVDATSTACLAPPAMAEPFAGTGPYEPVTAAEQHAQAAPDAGAGLAAAAEPGLESWTQQPVAGYQPEPLVESPVTEYLRQPEPERVAAEHSQHPEPEPVAEQPMTPRSESLFRPEPATGGYPAEQNWFDGEPKAERPAFEEPAAHHAEQPETPQDLQPEAETGGESSAHTPGAAGQEPAGGAEGPHGPAPVLPKRQRRDSPPGGFGPPRPIQPSMRAVERRDPVPEACGGHSGSLFEPGMPPGQFAPEPPPSRNKIVDSVPPGPFGPGSAMPRPGGGCPSEDFGVKASVTALRYCTDESPQFSRMVAEVWFRTAADAERVGFRPLT